MNTSGYQTLHEPFGRAVDDGTGYYQMPETTVTGYINCFRVFVPPGARIIALNIFEYGGQTAIVRHKIPPTTRDIPEDYFVAASRHLEQLIKEDQIISENHEGHLTIISEGIPLPYVTINQAGWLYAYITGGSSSNVYYNKYQLGVNVKEYNEWFDREDWDKNVEGVVVFGGSTPTPTPIPIPVPTPVPTPTPIPMPGTGGPTTINLGDFGIWNYRNGQWVR